MKIAINGFGRMGRLALRAGWGKTDLDFIHINEPRGDAECAAHLLEFDTVHGRWAKKTGHTARHVIIEGQSLGFSEKTEPSAVNWAEMGVEMLFECSGKYRTAESLQPFFDAGIKKILVACPVKSKGVLNIVYGVNHHLYKAAQHQIVTAASCTTNCLAPVVKVIQENIGIVRGSMTSLHDLTNTQVVVDAPHKDLRRARSAVNSLIPTTTGSATAIAMIYPELAGKLNGHAVRVPLLNSSLVDCVFELNRKSSMEEVSRLFAEAAEGALKDILGYEERPLVSTDFVNDARSGIIDGPSILLVDGSHLKIYAWYDNEWGYVNRMIDIAKMIAPEF